MRQKLTIKGQQYYRWRAVDGGNALDVSVAMRHPGGSGSVNCQQGFTPRVIVTDKPKAMEVAGGNRLSKKRRELSLTADE